MESPSIEKGIPIPDSQIVKSPMRKMAVGDSFTAPISRRQSIQTMASKLKKQYKLEFIIRKIDDETIRIWRK